MKFIQSPAFRRDTRKLFDESELVKLMTFLALRPDAGDIIPQSGGCRKIRWALEGRGRRGGARIIYFHRLCAGEVLLLRAYAKNDRENLTAKETKALKKEVKTK
jgi:hypothetical protein